MSSPVVVPLMRGGGGKVMVTSPPVVATADACLAAMVTEWETYPAPSPTQGTSDAVVGMRYCTWAPARTVCPVVEQLSAVGQKNTGRAAPGSTRPNPYWK